MSQTYTGVGSNITAGAAAAITEMVDGDPGNASSAQTPLQTLTDLTAYLQNQLLAMRIQNWFSVGLPGSSDSLNDCAVGNGIYVIGGQAATGPLVTSWTSPDLQTWTEHQGVVNDRFFALMYDGTNNLFIASTGSNGVYTSPDGGTTAWTQRNASVGKGPIATIGGVTVIPTLAGTTTWVSSNGTTWAAGGALPNTGANCIAVGAPSGSNIWVVGVTNTTNQIAFSTNNGTSWTAASLPSSTAGCVAVIYISGTFYAVDAVGKTYTSTNGSSWSQVGTMSGISSQTAISCTSIAGNAREIVYMDQVSTNTIWQSFNGGANWTKRTLFPQIGTGIRLGIKYDATNGLYFANVAINALYTSRLTFS